MFTTRKVLSYTSCVGIKRPSRYYQSYNDAMIQQYIQQNYPGLPITQNLLDYAMNNSGGGQGDQLDAAIKNSPQYNTMQQTNAQNAYQGAINTAVGGLQTQKTNLASQYGSLLSTVTEEYQPLINQTTASAGAEEARRGLSPDSLLNQQQVQGALQPVYGAEAANAQEIGAGSISDTNTLTQAIANMQAGGAGTASQLPLQYGQLALSQAALPSQIALNQAQGAQASALAKQAQFLPSAPGVSFFNTGNQQVINPALQILKQLGFNLTG